MSDVDPAKMSFVAWITLCLIVCFWFLNKFAKGRRQFQTNLHVIEDGLRKMQQELEARELEKNIGCVDDVEDISSFLQKFNENQNQETVEVVEADSEIRESTKLEEPAEDEEEDKKHI